MQLSSPGRRSPRQARSRRRGAGFATMLAALALAGCANVTPPSVRLLNVGLVSAGLLEQQAQVVLCVTNPNARPLRFRRADFRLTVADRLLAQGVSDGALNLPPQASVPVTFDTQTTTRNLGTQLASIFTSGAVNYDISGSVTLESFPLAVPFDSRGQIGLDTVTRELRPVGAALSGGCARPYGAPVYSPP